MIRITTDTWIEDCGFYHCAGSRGSTPASRQAQLARPMPEDFQSPGLHGLAAIFGATPMSSAAASPGHKHFTILQSVSLKALFLLRFWCLEKPASTCKD